LAVPEDVCDFSLKPAGEPALLIVLRNDDVGKHWRKGRNGNLIEPMLLFLVMACVLTHRVPPLLISLIFDWMISTTSLACPDSISFVIDNAYLFA
jgi:hypothetical protein